MAKSNLDRRARATALFKLAVKANSSAVHRTLNRPPKGKGWIQAANSPTGLMCRPAKVREAIELFDEFPDIVALNQIALAYEMLGEFEAARMNFTRCARRPKARATSPISRQRNSASHALVSNERPACVRPAAPEETIATPTMPFRATIVFLICNR